MVKAPWPQVRQGSSAPPVVAQPRLAMPKKGSKREREQLQALLAMAGMAAVDEAAIRARLEELDG